MELFFIFTLVLFEVLCHAWGSSLVGGKQQGSLKMIYKQIVAALKLGQLISWAHLFSTLDLVHVLKIGFGPSKCQYMHRNGLKSSTINVNTEKGYFFVCVTRYIEIQNSRKV